MASGLNANKLMSEIKITQYDFDPDSTESTAVGWVDMRDFSKFLVGFFRTVGTSNITLLIKAATSAAGANAQTIVTKTISAQPNAVGDYVFLECLAEQIAQVVKMRLRPRPFGQGVVFPAGDELFGDHAACRAT